MKHLSSKTKQFVVKALQAGEKYKSVAERYGMSPTGVGKLYRKIKKEDPVDRLKGSGRPKKLSKRETRVLVRCVKANPRRNNTNVRRDAAEMFGIQSSTSTAQRVLR